MVLTINPAVSRTKGALLAQAFAFLSGSILGGLTSLLVGLIVLRSLQGTIGSPILTGIVCGAVILAILRDFGLPVWLPYRERQVPEGLRELLPAPVVAAEFGFELGVGFLTLFTYSVHLAVVLALPLLDSTTKMLAGVILFSLGRTLVLLVGLDAQDPEEIADRFISTRARRLVLRLSTSAASLGVVFGWAVIRPP